MQFIVNNQDSFFSAASASSASAGVSPSPSPIAPTIVDLPRRRGRGRPPGSKNKPKPKIDDPNSSPTPTRIPFPSSLRTLFLQVDPNHDVVESLTNFCRTRLISLSVLSASGSLSYFVLRHPSSPSSNLIFRGRFEIISISATVIDSRHTPSPSSYFLSTFTVTVRGSRGEVIGGAVNGPLVAAGQVFIVAVSLSSSDQPTYHRLPEMEEEGNGNTNTNTSVVEGNKRRQISLEGGGGGGTFAHSNLGGSGDMVWDPPEVVRPPY